MTVVWINYRSAWGKPRVIMSISSVSERMSSDMGRECSILILRAALTGVAAHGITCGRTLHASFRFPATRDGATKVLQPCKPCFVIDGKSFGLHQLATIDPALSRYPPSPRTSRLADSTLPCRRFLSDIPWVGVRPTR
jgi:hypothetical protein